MSNGVKFGTVHSDMLDLILTARSIAMPQPKRYQVDVPGMDGTLDVTGALTPYIMYKNRPVTFTFEFAGDPDSWDSAITSVMTAIHGKQLHVVEDVDATRYWDAFCTVSSFVDKEHLGKFVISCDCYPYKLQDVSLVKNIVSSDSFSINGIVMPTLPSVTVSASMDIVLNGNSFSFDAGTHKNADFQLIPGNNSISVSGTGTLTLNYKKGTF